MCSRDRALERARSETARTKPMAPHKRGVERIERALVGVAAHRQQCRHQCRQRQGTRAREEPALGCSGWCARLAKLSEEISYAIS
jgi:hypothetical protein